MKKYLRFFLIAALLLLQPAIVAQAAKDSDAAAQPALGKRSFPVPQTVSPELQSLIAAEPWPFWNYRPTTAQEWKAWADQLAVSGSQGLPKLREQMGVTMTAGRIGGVPVFTLSPQSIPVGDSDKVLLHFHGGGYVLNHGESGTQEAILMAALGGFKVISVDYRMAPEHPYPAAIDDAVAVYKELIKTTAPEKIGVFGTSTGGSMTLILALRAKDEGLPLPAALAAGTPWTDLAKTGDTYFTHEGLDNIIYSYDGWIRGAVDIYTNGHDLKDPMLSPVYGDVSGFPPTILTSGTRDIFLSNTVRMHLKLREAGVIADLIVFEGMSHAQYHFLPDAPETKFHFAQLAQFFRSHLK